MSLMFGHDSNDKVVPLLLDANGNIIVSASQLTSTGGKISVDANGRLNANVFPHDYYSVLTPTIVYASTTANNAENTIYTVPAGKTLYITSLYLCIGNTAATAQNGRARLYNAASVLQVEWIVSAKAGDQMNQSIGLSSPLAVPTGYTVRNFSSLLNCFSTVTIAGYLL